MESPVECDPHSVGFPYVECTPGAQHCPGSDRCGKSARKCYCTTTLFPKPDPIRKARRVFEKELQPVNKNLSDLQEKVRAMYINEMRGCICGAAIPDNPFPNQTTCKCSQLHSQSGSKSKKPRKCRSGTSRSSRSSCSSRFETRPSPCVCVGSVPFARTRKSSRKRSRRKCSKSRSSSKSVHKKRRKSRHSRSSRKGQKSASSRKSSKKRYKMKEAVSSLRPLTESQQELMCRRLTELARNMFYKGPVSHYLNQNSPVYYNNVCDCSSMDALADPRDRDPKRDVCALTTANFPLRPGQAMTCDPDDPQLRAYSGPARTRRKHKHKSRQSRSPSVIKLKLRLKRSKSGSKRKGRKKRRIRRSKGSSGSRSRSQSGSRRCTRSGSKRSNRSSASKSKNSCSSNTQSRSSTANCSFQYC